MNEDPFHLNQPVHQARRDVFYEKAVCSVRRIDSCSELGAQRDIAEQALYLFVESRQDAEAANRSGETCEQSLLFADFLDTAIDNAQSITRMLRRKMVSGDPGNAVALFLGSAEPSRKMHGHYCLCSALILQGLISILEDAELPFRELRQMNREGRSLIDQARYEKAYQHFSELAGEEAAAAGRQQRSRSTVRISGSAL